MRPLVQVLSTQYWTRAGDGRLGDELEHLHDVLSIAGLPQQASSALHLRSDMVERAGTERRGGERGEKTQAHTHNLSFIAIIILFLPPMAFCY
eukprot:m.133500 g.133500  ORF g.133500 m.133500 type:complete len:93 (-) comp15801_c3_seq1:783-1061(-)